MERPVGRRLGLPPFFPAAGGAPPAPRATSATPPVRRAPAGRRSTPAPPSARPASLPPPRGSVRPRAMDSGTFLRRPWERGRPRYRWRIACDPGARQRYRGGGVQRGRAPGAAKQCRIPNQKGRDFLIGTAAGVRSATRVLCHLTTELNGGPAHPLSTRTDRLQTCPLQRLVGPSRYTLGSNAYRSQFMSGVFPYLHTRERCVVLS
jgi:hypothetical protein